MVLRYIYMHGTEAELVLSWARREVDLDPVEQSAGHAEPYLVLNVKSVFSFFFSQLIWLVSIF